MNTALKSALRATPNAVVAPALLAALLAGCVNLAPPQPTPLSAAPRQWPVAAPQDMTQDAMRAADIGWAEFHGDAQLRELIAMALANNRNLRTAALNVERARALYRVTAAAALPAIDGSAVGTAQRAAGQRSRVVGVEVGITAFELDFFGRVHNLRDQALASFLALEETQRAAQISLVAEVAIAYATLLADRQRLELAQGTLASQQTSLSLTQRSFEVGTLSGLDVALAQTTVDAARADIATFRTRVDTDWNALELLVGQPLVRTLDTRTAAPAPAATAYPAPGAGATTTGVVVTPPAAADAPLLAFTASLGVPAQTPSELLQRRPDVLAAERSLQGAVVNIGAARAACFPRITLTTSVGTSSRELSGLFGAGGAAWSFMPALSVPLFDAGAGEATVRVAQVDRDIALAAYDLTVQTAFREVGDALAQRRDIGELLAARQSLVAATTRSFELSYARYRLGVDSSLSALDAQRSLYTAQQNLISARLLEATNLVTLYSVLGGGWLMN